MAAAAGNGVRRRRRLARADARTAGAARRCRRRWQPVVVGAAAQRAVRSESCADGACAAATAMPSLEWLRSKRNAGRYVPGDGVVALQDAHQEAWMLLRLLKDQQRPVEAPARCTVRAHVDAL